MVIWFFVNTMMAVCFGLWQNNGTAGVFAWFVGALYLAFLLFLNDIADALLAISGRKGGK